MTGEAFLSGIVRQSLSSRHLNKVMERVMRMHQGRTNADGNVSVELGRWPGSQYGWSTIGEGTVMAKGVEKVASSQATWSW